MPNSLYIACQPWDWFIKCYCTYFAGVQQHWTPQQRQEAAALFQDFILCNRLPPKRTIATAIRQSTHLKSRTWRMVREHLRFHHIKKSLRQEEDEDI